MQALKALVAGLGALIVIGMALLVWALYQKATNPDFKLFGDAPGPSASAPEPVPATGAGAFGMVSLPLAAGCRIADMDTGGGRLFVRTEGGPGCDAVFVIDGASGKILGNVSAPR